MDPRDRWEPKLRVPASGLGGSGYRIPTRAGDDGKPILVPGVTTALGALEKGGIVQWAVDNTAAYAISNIDALLNRTEEQGFGFLRWYHSRMKPKDFDDPDVDIHNYSNGVLNDLAELGTVTHDWVADYLNGNEPEGLVRDEQVEMINRFLDWLEDNMVEVIATEVTVVGPNWAGTLDYILRVNGITYLVDLKTSRKIRETHYAQLAALGSAESMMVQVDKDHPEAVEYESKKWGKTYWIEEPLPDFSQYAVLHLRPNDWDHRGTYLESFCEFKVIPHNKIEAAFGLFEAGLTARHAQRKLKELGKGEK